MPLPLSNSDKEFLAEIAASNGGTDTMIYQWALATVAENQWKQIKKMQKAGK